MKFLLADVYRRVIGLADVFYWISCIGGIFDPGRRKHY